MKVLVFLVIMHKADLATEVHACISLVQHVMAMCKLNGIQKGMLILDINGFKCKTSSYQKDLPFQ